MNGQKVVIVADLGFGDAGKGSIVDYLSRQSKDVVNVRYNGGPQAAHNVITPEGIHHTFAHLGSGSFAGAKTHLSRYMLVNPFNLDLEIEHLESLGLHGLWEGISIEREALVITPWHVAANRLQELSRGDGRHGSCGQGIGEAQSDAVNFNLSLRVEDLSSATTVRRKLTEIRAFKLEQAEEYLGEVPEGSLAKQEYETLRSEQLIDVCIEFYDWFTHKARIVDRNYLGYLLKKRNVIFEGAQGVLLDEWFGFHPYTTWSTTTFENANDLLSEQEFEGKVEKLGLLRSYGVRHGPGPFPTEDEALACTMPDYHNCMNQWQREFRVGYLDLILAKYAIEVCGDVDSLVITNLDRMAHQVNWPIAVDYRTESSTCFDFESDIATRIRVGVKDNLEYQSQITEALESTKPDYQVINTCPGLSQYLQFISDKLSVPISLLSSGPTAKDKVKI